MRHLGVDLGRSLMPGDENDNPKGYWENEKIVEIHEKLLRSLGYTWHDARLLPDNWLTMKVVRAKKNEIIEIISTEFTDYQVLGIKDPRICRLLPLWKEIFSELGLKTVYVHIFRNPLEVAMSLERRDGFSSSYSLLLWFFHNVEALQNTSGENRVFLEYEEFLQDWRGSIKKLEQKLDVRWPIEIAQVATDIDQFLSPDLYHNTCDRETLVRHEDISEHISTLYNLLRGASTTGAAVMAKKFEDFSKRYLNAVNLLKPWQSPKAITPEQIARIEGLDASLTEARLMLKERNKYIGLLEPALEHAQQIVQQQNNQIEKLDTALTKAQQLVDERNKKIDLLESALEEAQQIVRQQNDRINKLDTGLREAQGLVEERNKKIDLLESALEEAQ
ncbi:MAG: hypothetical protein ACRESZ_21440 [Methylococcales bacterium]